MDHFLYPIFAQKTWFQLGINLRWFCPFSAGSFLPIFWSIFGPLFWTPQKTNLSSRVSTPHFWDPPQKTCLSEDSWYFGPGLAKMAKTVKNRQFLDFSKNRPFLDHFWSILDKTDQKFNVSSKIIKNPYAIWFLGYPCPDPLFWGSWRESGRSLY